MKNYAKSILTVCIIAMALVCMYAFTTASGNDEGKLGDVKYSILALKDFQQENGTGWILLDDAATTKLNGSKLKEYYNIPQLPDARGVFIRGYNGNRDKNTGDTDPARKVATSQMDAFQGHWHKFKGNVLVLPNPNYAPKYIVASNGGAYYPKNSAFDVQYVTDPIADGSNGDPRTSPETRPRNISLYTYIKIN